MMERKHAVGIGFLAIYALMLACSAPACQAQEVKQKTFGTAKEAAHALYQAIKSGDMAAMTAILGAPTRVICSEDSTVDKRERAQFVQKYQEMRRLVKEPDGTTVLYIGAENWPFPFPIMGKNGVWQFDTAAGTREIMFRRIGENEMAAMDTCRALVSASKPMVGQNPEMMHGYYLRSVMSGGGHKDKLAYIAYPVAYRTSGVMTFLVDRDGKVYAKDLGPNTGKHTQLAELRHEWSSVHPDSTWTLEK